MSDMIIKISSYKNVSSTIFGIVYIFIAIPAQNGYLFNNFRRISNKTDYRDIESLFYTVNKLSKPDLFSQFSNPSKSQIIRFLIQLKNIISGFFIRMSFKH